MDDVYRHIVSFISSEERPVVSRAYLFSYVEQKWRRLNGIPLLVDIWWHSPWKCHKYCVCHVRKTILTDICIISNVEMRVQNIDVK